MIAPITEDITQKKCSKCGETKDLDQFWKNKSIKDGYCNQCKDCKRAAKGQTARFRPERTLTGKQCTRCKILKDFNKFYKSKHTKDGQGCVCKDCLREIDGHKAKFTPERTLTGKQCSECKILKDFDQFWVNKNVSDGYVSKCKDCCRLRDGHTARFKPERTLTQKQCSGCKILKDLDQFHKCKKNKDNHVSMCKDCVRNNKGQTARFKPERTLTQKQCITCKILKDFDQFPTSEKWIDGYCSSCRECSRLIHNLRTNVRQGLHRQSIKKSAKTEELLGCSWRYYKQHMQNKFKPGMTWDNNTPDGWHIGHIIDCCAFDLKDPRQQKIAFHYSNLEPQWAAYNFSKPKMRKRTDEEIKQLLKNLEEQGDINYAKLME